MKHIKIYSWGFFFSFIWLSSVQSWQFEMPTPIPGVGLIISKDPGVKLGIPFLGGMVRNSFTMNTVYRDVKWIFDKSSKLLIDECLGSSPEKYTFTDPFKKRVAIVVAVCLKDQILRKHLQDFYDIKQKIHRANTLEEKEALQKKCLEMKSLIKRLMN